MPDLRLTVTSALVAGLALTSCAPAGAGGQSCETDATFINNETGQEFDIVSTAASMPDGNIAFTIYAADFEIDFDELSTFSAPTIPTDGNLLYVYVTTYNAEGVPPEIQVGDTIPAGTQSNERVLNLVHRAADVDYGTNTGIDGSLTVDELGEALCVTVEYEDEQKSLSGTIGALVHD